MRELKYAIGGLDFEPETLRQLPVSFVIGLEDDVASFYTTEKRLSHKGVALYFELGKTNDKDENTFDSYEGKQVIGGGWLRCTLNSASIEGASGTFGAIPDYAARKFGDILLPELVSMGLQVTEVRIRVATNNLNPYWTVSQ